MTTQEIQDKIMKYPKNMNLYYQNISIELQAGIFQTKDALEDLVQHGFLKRMKALKYNEYIMSEFTVGEGEEFDWSKIQDPDDYTPLTKHDVEIINCYRRA